MHDIITVPLATITPLGRSTLTASEDAVALVTDRDQWAYSAKADFDIPSIENECQIVKICLEIESGVLGVGLLRDDTWLVRAFAAEGPTTKELRLLITSQTRGGKLVFDNWTEGDKPARAVIRSITVQRDDTQELFRRLDASRLIIFEHSGAVGLFGTLTSCLCLSWKCRSHGLTPYFILNAPHYIDKRYGENWLEYYFVQHNVSDSDKTKANLIAQNAISQQWQGGIRIFQAPGNSHFPIESLECLNNEIFDLTLNETNHFFLKEFHLTPTVSECINRFVTTHFLGYRVLGVHYRGADKGFDEADPVPYSQMLNIISEYESGFSKIFLATDDPEFAKRCSSAHFGNKLVLNSRFSHSDKMAPLEAIAPHLRETSNNYQKGFSAVVEAVLLSKCDLLIKTCSTFSAWSKIFNPSLPLVLVGRPYSNPWPGKVPVRNWGYWPESSLHGRSLEFQARNRIEKEIFVESYPYSSAAVEELRKMTPRLTASLARQIIGFVEEISSEKLYAPPGVSTITEWAGAVQSRRWRSLDLRVVNSTLEVLLKDERDRLRVRGRVAEEALVKVMARLNSVRACLFFSKGNPEISC